MTKGRHDRERIRIVMPEQALGALSRVILAPFFGGQGMWRVQDLERHQQLPTSCSSAAVPMRISRSRSSVKGKVHAEHGHAQRMAERERVILVLAREPQQRLAFGVELLQHFLRLSLHGSEIDLVRRD